MKVFRAVGLGVVIVLLQFLVPSIFSELEETMILFFDTAQAGLGLTKENLENPPTFSIPE